jgi:DNA-directed RNA polymerase specialized sigma24 family protein
MTPITPDSDLLHRVVHLNDHDSFGVLVHRYATTVYAIAYGILLDRGLAEDAVEEAFLEARRTAQDFDPRRSTVAAWLRHLARIRAQRLAQNS